MKKSVLPRIGEVIVTNREVGVWPHKIPAETFATVLETKTFSKKPHVRVQTFDGAVHWLAEGDFRY